MSSLFLALKLHNINYVLGMGGVERGELEELQERLRSRGKCKGGEAHSKPPSLFAFFSASLGRTKWRDLSLVSF